MLGNQSLLGFTRFWQVVFLLKFWFGRIALNLVVDYFGISIKDKTYN
jgi:hypothetical protein